VDGSLHKAMVLTWVTWLSC